MEDLGAVLNGRDLLKYLAQYNSKARLWSEAEARAAAKTLAGMHVGDIEPAMDLDAYEPQLRPQGRALLAVSCVETLRLVCATTAPLHSCSCT